MNKSPAWTAYKQALARVANAGARLTAAQVDNPADLKAAEVEFAAILMAYDMARLRMISPMTHANIVDLASHTLSRSSA